MTLPPTLRQLVDRVEVLEEQRDPRTVVVVPTVQDAEGIDPSAIVIIDGVAMPDPDYQPTDRDVPILGPQDVPALDVSDVVQESLRRPRGVRHSLDTVIRWIPK